MTIYQVSLVDGIFMASLAQLGEESYRKIRRSKSALLASRRYVGNQSNSALICLARKYVAANLHRIQSSRYQILLGYEFRFDAQRRHRDGFLRKIVILTSYTLSRRDLGRRYDAALTLVTV